MSKRTFEGRYPALDEPPVLKPETNPASGSLRNMFGGQSVGFGATPCKSQRTRRGSWNRSVIVSRQVVRV